MIQTLQLLVAPLAAAAFSLWAALLAFASELEGTLPRAAGWEADGRGLPLSRRLHVAHLILLVLAAAAAGGAVAWWAWPPVPGLFRLLLAVLLVWVVGDVLPRMLGVIAPELVQSVQGVAARTLAPFGVLFRLVARAERVPMGAAGAPLPGGLSQREMLFGIFSLAETSVAEVMTPRIDIVAVNGSADRDEVVATLRRSEHARLLVYDGHPDAVVGVLYAKDLLPSLSPEGAAVSWRTLIRPASFVPEAKTLDRQLRDFQRGPSHIAVVVDEFGGTAGLVTLEDILEQIVGEIQDEYDVDEVEPIQRLGEHAFRVEGGVPLSELEALLGRRFGREDVTTVGGLVLAQLGRVPRAGERLSLGGVELTVEQVVRRRVRRVAVALAEEVAPGEEGER